MGTFETFELRRERVVHALGRVRWLPLLLARVTVGVIFVVAGVEKLSDMAKAVDEFTHLGIPAASFFAPFVGTTEFLAGAMLIAGLLTRLATIPLAVTMVVAIFTAKLAKIHSIAGFLGLEETLILVVLVAIFILGPGRASLDETIERRYLDGRAAPLFRRRASA